MRTNNEESDRQKISYEAVHQKDEIDAAEALANLAFNCRQRMLNTTTIRTALGTELRTN